MERIKNLFRLLLVLSTLALVSPLCAQSTPIAKADTPAIEVKMIQPGDVALPAEFQVALYENLIEEFQKEGAFREVYRDGDRRAMHDSNVITLYATVTKFKQGNQMERDVTTVAGSTSITIHCRFNASSGSVLLERDIEGKVRLIGDNLKATDDFAKKAAKTTPKDFSDGTALSNPAEPKGGV
jgi:hypothetical protein